jgi:hypothetical protein
MWEGANVPEGTSSATPHSGAQYAPPPDLGLCVTSISEASAAQLVGPGQGAFTTPPQSCSVYDTPSSQGNPEEEGHGGLGTAMSWESNWQGFMHQLGVPYENDAGF